MVVILTIITVFMHCVRTQYSANLCEKLWSSCLISLKNLKYVLYLT